MSELETDSPGRRFALPGEDPLPRAGRAVARLRDRRSTSSLLVLGLWTAASLGLGLLFGVPKDPATVGAWLMTGLAALCIGRTDWYRAVFDWMPFVAVYTVYEHVRGLAFSLDSPAMWRFPIRFDAAVGGGTLPAAWLQQHLMPAGDAIAWWEVPLGLVYMSHFYASVLVAAALWIRDRPAFKAFLGRLIGVLGIGMAVFVLVPTAPPWAAAHCTTAQVQVDPASPHCLRTGGLRHGRHPRHQSGGPSVLTDELHGSSGTPVRLLRTTARGFMVLPGSDGFVPGAIRTGMNLANPMAAFPSLHAACSALIAVFFWPRVRRRWRPLLAAYPLAMAFGLVWSLDHYVFDILSGWALTGVVCTVAVLWRRVRRRDDLAEPAGLDPLLEDALRGA